MSGLAVEKLNHVFNSREMSLPVLDDLSFRVSPGEVVSILGPSGCGKSTLLRCIAGLLAPSTGSVSIDGRPPESLRRERGIGFGFQAPCLMGWRTVERNISLPLEIGEQDRSKPFSLSRIDELLAMIQMTQFRHHFPTQLSEGMKHRTALARALVTSPKVLLLDEPLAGLDLLTRRELMSQIGALLERQECLTVIVTHSVEEAVFWGQRIILLTHRPASILRIVHNHTQRPRTLAYAETEAFHELVDECSDLLLSLKQNDNGNLR